MAEACIELYFEVRRANLDARGDLASRFIMSAVGLGIAGCRGY